MQCPAHAVAAQLSLALGEEGRGVGEAFLGLHQRTCIFLRTMLLLSDLGLCPRPEKGGAPGWAAECSGRRIPVSARLAGAGLLLMIVFLSSLGCPARAPGLSMAEGDTLVSVDYEVFGKVQGVFFRKYTQAEGKKLGLVGWVQNTDRGTVQGQLQGPISKVRPMQEWLEKTGSPKSHIDRAKFNNEKVILKLDYSDFQIVK